jgi:hypothetical protein
MRSDVVVRRLSACAIAVLAGMASTLVLAGGVGPKFYSDDPIAVDRDTRRDASGAARFELGNYSDFIENTFLSPADRRDVRAMNVNTVDEVPDSSWFTNRIGRGALSIDDIVRGPDSSDAPAPREWLIVDGKSTGRQPGFRAVDPDDPSRQLYQIEFDSPEYPELATGAEVIGTAIYHALGYNVVDVYLVDVDPKRVRISESATIRDARGQRRFTAPDLESVLRRAGKRPDGTYRALASRFAPGKPLGQFRYHGTRSDDPNDIYPHEHRRELRANRVFCAWLNHDDSRANNTLDMLVEKDGSRFVRHYMFDFGSILGSGTDAPDYIWAGREYVTQSKPALLSLISFGLYVRPALRVPYPGVPAAAGRIEGDRFDPVAWRPHYRNPAFANLRADDAFWGARLVAAFSEEAIAEIVRKARYSDPKVTDYLTGALIKRRDRIARAWLTHVNPVVSPSLSQGGVMRFANAARDAGVATAPTAYDIVWGSFHNATSTHVSAGGPMRVPEPETTAPAAALTGEYVAATIRTVHPAYPRWRAPVTVYFRKAARGWSLVGIDRDAAAPRRESVTVTARRF